MNLSSRETPHTRRKYHLLAALREVATGPALHTADHNRERAADTSALRTAEPLAEHHTRAADKAAVHNRAAAFHTAERPDIEDIREQHIQAEPAERRTWAEAARAAAVLLVAALVELEQQQQEHGRWDATSNSARP